MNSMVMVSATHLTRTPASTPHPNALAVITNGIYAITLCTNRIGRSLAGAADSQRLTCIMAAIVIVPIG